MPARVLVVAADATTQLELANMLRRDGHEVNVTPDAADAMRILSAERPNLTVVDDDLGTPRGLELVARIRRSEPQGVHLPIVLVGSGNDVDAKVAALRGGADDYLAKPVHPQELSARVRGLLARFVRTQPAPPRRKSAGRVIAYYGAKGGVGSTTLAINTAIALHREQKRRVALVDASLQFGDHRVFLDLNPNERSIADVVTATAIDADIVRQAMVEHQSGIELLLAPSSPEQSDLVSGEQHHLLHIIELLRTMYDYVVIDMDKRLDDHMLDVIGAADRLVVVMTADLSCLKNVRLVLGTMKQLHVPSERLMLVLNRANAYTGISANSVESVLRTPIAHMVINDYRSAVGSLNSGTPFMAKRPDSALGRAVADLAKLLDRQATGDVEARAQAPRLELAPAR